MSEPMRVARRQPALQLVPAIGRADRASLQDSVYDRLRSAVMFGKLVPGEPVTISGLAASLGTSPIPVREATRRLAAERAIEILPNGSLSIPAMTRDRFVDLRRARVLIEGYATTLAAPRITAAQLKRMALASERREAACRAGNLRNALHFGYRFRLALFEAADSPALLPMIESLWLQVGPFFNFALVNPTQTLSTRNQQHALEALRAADAVAASRWIERDVMEVGDLILEGLVGDAGASPSAV
jgi:DNA-binding GntR family transcriptional regulator